MVTITKNATVLGEDCSTAVDVRTVLEWAYSQQKARVDKMLTAEGDGYNPEIRKEMKLQVDILKQVTEYYFAIGVLKKAPKTTTVKNNGATTIIESEGRTQVLMSMQEHAQFEVARAKLQKLIEAERKEIEDEEKGQLH